MKLNANSSAGGMFGGTNHITVELLWSYLGDSFQMQSSKVAMIDVATSMCW